MKHIRHMNLATNVTAVLFLLFLVLLVTSGNAAALTVSLKPTSKSFKFNGSAGNVAIAVTGAEASATSLAVTAATAEPWITGLTPAVTIPLRNGKGGGKLSFRVENNGTALTRTGAIVVSGPGFDSQTYTITQTGLPCKLKITPAASTGVSPDGLTGSFNTGLPEGCTWSASPSGTWITVAAEGTAADPVTFTVEPNTGAARTGAIAVNASLAGTVTAKKTYKIAQLKTAGGTAGPTIGSPTTITRENAAKVVNVINNTGYGSYFAFDGFSFFSDFGQLPDATSASPVPPPQPSIKALAKAVGKFLPYQQQIPQGIGGTNTCADGGSVSWAVAGTAVTVTYAGCRQGDNFADGTVQWAPSATGAVVMNFGTSAKNFVTRTYEPGTNYGTLNEAAQGYFSMTVSSAGSTVRFLNTGSVESVDYTVTPAEKTVVVSRDYSIDYTAGTASYTYTSNGYVKRSLYKGDTFTNSEELVTSGLAVSGLFTDTSFSYTLDGTFAIKNLPASCIDGTFVVDTTTPISYNTTTGFAGGVITLQQTGGNNVVITIHADGTATAIIAGETVDLTTLASSCTVP